VTDRTVNPGPRPFLDFYAAHHVVPVHYRRDAAFVARRTWLLATLGIPPALLRGADVLEFGPGTGDNASVLTSFGPRRYVLVDANPASIEALAARFSTPAPGGGER
jgi:predicted RNA methylase